MNQTNIQAEEDFGRELNKYADEWVAVGDQIVVKHHPELAVLVGSLSDSERTDLTVFKVDGLPYA